MFVRLSGQLIDLRQVRSIEAVDGKTYHVVYENGTSANIAIEGANPIHDVDLANAMITILNNVEKHD